MAGVLRHHLGLQHRQRGWHHHRPPGNRATYQFPRPPVVRRHRQLAVVWVVRAVYHTPATLPHPGGERRQRRRQHQHPAAGRALHLHARAPVHPRHRMRAVVAVERAPDKPGFVLDQDRFQRRQVRRQPEQPPGRRATEGFARVPTLRRYRNPFPRSDIRRAHRARELLVGEPVQRRQVLGQAEGPPANRTTYHAARVPVRRGDGDLVVGEGRTHEPTALGFGLALDQRQVDGQHQAAAGGRTGEQFPRKPILRGHRQLAALRVVRAAHAGGSVRDQQRRQRRQVGGQDQWFPGGGTNQGAAGRPLVGQDHDRLAVRCIRRTHRAGRRGVGDGCQRRKAGRQPHQQAAGGTTHQGPGQPGGWRHRRGTAARNIGRDDLAGAPGRLRLQHR